MDILVGNHNLAETGGSETFTFALIEELRRRGHSVEYFCFKKGMVSELIEMQLDVKFMKKNEYNLILANHNTVVDTVHKKGFTIQTCHGIFSKLEQPSDNANCHVSISNEVHDYLFSLGFPSIIINNGINCDKFNSKKPLRKENPSVLSMCHSESAHQKVKEACEILGFDFGILDKYKDGSWNVENNINEFDLVVGIGRTAYEALACGRAVVFFDERKYAGSKGDGYFLDCFPESLKFNCSGRALNLVLQPLLLSYEIKKYKAEHGMLARKYALQTFNIERSVDSYFKYFLMMIDLNKRKKRNAIKELLPKSIITKIRFLKKYL